MHVQPWKDSESPSGDTWSHEGETRRETETRRRGTDTEDRGVESLYRPKTNVGEDSASYPRQKSTTRPVHTHGE